MSDNPIRYRYPVDANGFYMAAQRCRVVGAWTFRPDHTATSDITLRNSQGKVGALPIELGPGEVVHAECAERAKDAPLLIDVEGL